MLLFVYFVLFSVFQQVFGDGYIRYLCVCDRLYRGTRRNKKISAETPIIRARAVAKYRCSALCRIYVWLCSKIRSRRDDCANNLLLNHGYVFVAAVALIKRVYMCKCVCEIQQLEYIWTRTEDA